jgi:hypothetical protein
MAGGVQVQVEPAHGDLGLLPLAAEVGGAGDVVGVVEDLDGLAEAGAL